MTTPRQPIPARRRLLGPALALVLGTTGALVAAPAQAAEPSAPTLVAPADGAVGAAAPTRLQLRASDPDGDALDVRFQSRPKTGGTATNPNADFTLVTIPDTQNYTSIAANRPIMAAQTQWIVSHRADLNTALVTHLGDLTGQPDSGSQFQAASQYMARLDNAGVPNTVTTGNHDMNVSTGSAPLFDQYFPPSRYAGASWNSATVRYGGYLGQNLFGTDPVDRKNQDSFVLLTAGGMDFLVVNLEFNAPDYALDWAKKVLAAYPQRRAILVTHNMIGTDGSFSHSVTRPGGNFPDQIWDKLVAPSCSIFMVINGHNHDGDLGEAYREQNNSCGQPVRMALSDYQSRVNGGDGWLRYYTFKPSQNLIQAVTYSPTLDRYETDADSSFTIPYDMRTDPAPFADVGRVTVASGSTASVDVATNPGTAYEWRAIVSDGTSSVVGPTWSFSTAAATPSTLAADGFGRTVTAGWGSAETGGAWSVAGTASRYSVTGGSGIQTVPAGSTLTAALTAVSATSTDTTVDLSLGSIPNGAVYGYLAGRRVGTADYAARVKVSPGGGVGLNLTRSTTVIATGTIPSTTVAAGEALRTRVQVEGTSPTTIRAKVWKAGSTEPANWQVSVTDGTAGLQAAGGIAIAGYLSSSTTNGPLVLRADNLSVVPVGGTTPPTPPDPPTPTDPPAPTALAADAFARTVSAGWGSADTGGPWTVAGTASRYAVGGGVGSHQLTAGASTIAALNGVSSTAAETTVSLSPSAIPNGALYAYVGGRRVGGVEYGGRVKINPDGTVGLQTSRGDTTLTGGTVSGLTVAAGDTLRVRIAVQGTAPTTIRARVWKAGGTEPTTWQASATDSTAAMQAAGGVSLRTYLSSSTTSGAVTVRYDDLAVTPLG